VLARSWTGAGDMRLQLCWTFQNQLMLHSRILIHKPALTCSSCVSLLGPIDFCIFCTRIWHSCLGVSLRCVCVCACVYVGSCCLPVFVHLRSIAVPGKAPASSGSRATPFKSVMQMFHNHCSQRDKGTGGKKFSRDYWQSVRTEWQNLPDIDKQDFSSMLASVLLAFHAATAQLGCHIFDQHRCLVVRSCANMLLCIVQSQLLVEYRRSGQLSGNRPSTLQPVL
jgi:hypothetical protein